MNSLIETQNTSGNNAISVTSALGSRIHTTIRTNPLHALTYAQLDRLSYAVLSHPATRARPAAAPPMPVSASQTPREERATHTVICGNTHDLLIAAVIAGLSLLGRRTDLYFAVSQSGTKYS